MPLVVARENVVLPIIIDSGRLGGLRSYSFYSSHRGGFPRKITYVLVCACSQLLAAWFIFSY